MMMEQRAGHRGKLRRSPSLPSLYHHREPHSPNSIHSSNNTFVTQFHSPQHGYGNLSTNRYKQIKRANVEMSPLDVRILKEATQVYTSCVNLLQSSSEILSPSSLPGNNRNDRYYRKGNDEVSSKKMDLNLPDISQARGDRSHRSFALRGQYSSRLPMDMQQRMIDIKSEFDKSRAVHDEAQRFAIESILTKQQVRANSISAPVDTMKVGFDKKEKQTMFLDSRRKQIETVLACKSSIDDEELERRSAKYEQKRQKMKELANENSCDRLNRYLMLEALKQLQAAIVLATFISKLECAMVRECPTEAPVPAVVQMKESDRKPPVAEKEIVLDEQEKILLSAVPNSQANNSSSITKFMSKYVQLLQCCVRVV